MGEEEYPEDYPLPDTLVGSRVQFKLDQSARELKTHMQNSSYLNPPPVSWHVPRGQAVDMPREQLTQPTLTGAGKFFIAPLGAESESWPEGWIDLGFTTEGESFTAEFDISNANLKAAFGGKVGTTTETDELRKAKTMLYDQNATAEQLEEAALNLAARAAMVRAFDATEPEGDEPTISFTHTFNDQPGGGGTNRDRKAYTFVGFKSNGEGGTDKWYLTGQRSQGRAYTWRELGSIYPAIATGEFLVVAKWAQGK